MRYQINCTLYAGVSSEIDFPEGRTWADVSTWYVKWDNLHITFSDGTQLDIELHSDALEAIDWKRPKSVEVLEVNEETGEANYDLEIAST